MNTKKLSEARAYIRKLRGEDLTFGTLIESLRKSDDITQTDLARKMDMSRAHLCDIEKGRRFVSLSRAADFAKVMGYDINHFVALAIQDQLKQSCLNLRVELKKAA